MPEPLNDDIRALREELERLNNHRFIRIHNKPSQLLLYNFLRGIAFGLGTLLGASMLLSIAAWALAQIDFIPVIGEWAQRLQTEIDAVR